MMSKSSVKKLYLYCYLALVLAAVILGMSFVAQKAGMQYVEPFTFNTLRFFIGSLSLLVVIGIGEKFQIFRGEKHSTKELLKGGVAAGVALFFAFSINQYCMLEAQAGKAGFITALYIIFVPLFYTFIGNRLKLNVKIGVILALVGLYLLCVKGVSGIDACDVGILISAVFFAFHIMIVSFFTKKVSAMKLSCFQFFIAGMLSLPFMFMLENPAISNIIAGYRPILFIGIVVTAVAYTLQIFGQKAAKPVIATMILSSEAVFAVLGGVIMLGETLNGREVIGCLLMIVAIIVSQVPVKLFRHREQSNRLSDGNVRTEFLVEHGR